jgi:hypothetical protein
MFWVLVAIGGLFAFGFLVDWIYKKNGITYVEPEENAKHASESERVYIESHMHNIKNEHNNRMF